MKTEEIPIETQPVIKAHYSLHLQTRHVRDADALRPLPFLPRDVQVKTPHLPRPLRALPVQSFRLATAQLHP